MADAQRSERSGRLASGAGAVALLLATMWLVEVVDTIDSHRLDRDGIVPRSVSHLYGIVTAPFLHASFSHLLANSVPFLLLGLVIAFAGALRVVAVVAIVALVSGLGTWLTAAGGSVTVGASGVVFGFATYLVARGAFDRRAIELAVGVLVAVVFGGMLLGGLLPHPGVSWQAHLFGAVGGVIAAWALAARRREPAPG